MIGPPRLAVYWCRLYQVCGIPCRLLDQELAFIAELRTFQTRAPRNRFVPDRVRTRTCAEPRPSTSTAAMMTRTSSTMSGLIAVADDRPCVCLPLFTVT